ncbi:MAG: 50S ribosomal protein L9 [Jiangellales bacterium]
MKIILMQEVAGVGSAGDVAEVKDGYARNYLIPRGYAMRWTRGSESQIESLRKAKTEREIADQTSASEVAATLGSTEVVLTARAGDGGRLFGAITPSDIAGAIADASGVSVDRRRVEVSAPIKTLGRHAVRVRLHPEVVADVQIDVQAS